MCNHCSADPLSVLAEALHTSWSEATASPAFRDRWSAENPEFGQCTVTALVVQDLFEGELLTAEVAGFGRHVWNRLPDGGEVDFTRSQFPPDVVVPVGTVTPRQEIVGSAAAIESDLSSRYRLLSERLGGRRD